MVTFCAAVLSVQRSTIRLFMDEPSVPVSFVRSVRVFADSASEPSRPTYC